MSRDVYQIILEDLNFFSGIALWRLPPGGRRVQLPYQVHGITCLTPPHTPHGRRILDLKMHWLVR